MPSIDQSQEKWETSRYRVFSLKTGLPLAGFGDKTAAKEFASSHGGKMLEWMSHPEAIKYYEEHPDKRRKKISMLYHEGYGELFDWGVAIPKGL